MNSVFRLAARRTVLGRLPLEPEAAPVSEKRYSLSRGERVEWNGPGSVSFASSMTARMIRRPAAAS
jgi:hypothetical protein